MTRDEVLAIIKQAEEEGWEELDLSGQGLTEMPEEIGRLNQLKTLLLLGNNLATLPEALGQLTNLQHLDLRMNNLATLPEALGQLTNLQHLGLMNNNLGTLPEGLAQLTNLQRLYLGGNKLGTLPEGLAQLTNLRHLNLNGNNLGTLPEGLAQLPRLRTLFIAANPITTPSPEVLGNALTKSIPADLEAIRRYYAQLREAGEETFYEAKLLIVGEGGAGKTSLVRKLKQPYQPLNVGEGSTEGIKVIDWYFDLPAEYTQKQYRVNIWDFGGQEIYFVTHQFFLTKRSVYVLVADTRKQHTDFYEWLRMQEVFGGDSPILLLKNRNRREGNRFYIDNLPQLQERFPNLRQVIELDLDEVPKDVYWPVLLKELENHFMKLEHIGRPTPKTWVKVREALSTANQDTVTREQFLQLCYDQGVRREEDALQLSDYLHHLGDILHFQDDPILADIVILKPTWGLDAVYRVLDNAAIVDNWGEFTRHDLRRLWHEPHYRNYQQELLRLMENFQLCYPLADKPDAFIAPQLLKEEVPAYEWDHDDNLQLRYQYPVFMPRGILSRTIVKLHHRIEKQEFVWRAGVILKSKYARAELLELRGENQIRIRISGRNKRDLLMEIVRALEELHQSFPKLQYNKLIPCNCPTCTALTDPHFFRLDDLRERLAHGRNTIECNKPPFEQVNIHGLLEGTPLVTLEREQARSWQEALDKDELIEATGEAKVAVAKAIEKAFNTAELRLLCHSLDVNYGNLQGGTDAEKSVELVEYIARRGRFPNLLQICKEERPHINWTALAASGG